MRLNVLLIMTSFISFQAVSQADTLNCYVEEPRYNQEIEHDVDSGAFRAQDISLFEQIKASSQISRGSATVSITSPRTQSQLIATLVSGGVHYVFKMGGKVVLDTVKLSGYAIGFDSPISNFHIDASERDSAIVHFECNIDPSK